VLTLSLYTHSKDLIQTKPIPSKGPAPLFSSGSSLWTLKRDALLWRSASWKF